MAEHCGNGNKISPEADTLAAPPVGAAVVIPMSMGTTALTAGRRRHNL